MKKKEQRINYILKRVLSEKIEPSKSLNKKVLRKCQEVADSSKNNLYNKLVKQKVLK